MKVTVADCLELDVFKEAEVLAGKVNLINEVRSVSVLDIRDEKDIGLYAGDPGEILLTGFLGFKDDVKKQCAMVRKIAEKGCAALVVCYVGRGIKFIDGDVIEAAEETMLPLVLLPESMGYSRAITEIMDKIGRAHV